MPLRVVQVAPYPILPITSGGKARIVQLARALTRRGIDLTIVTPFHVTQRRALAAREPFTLRQVPYAPFVLPFLFVDRPFPYGALVSFHPGYRALLPVSLANYDVCQIDHPAFADLARHLPPNVPVAYGSQNVEFDYVSAECRSERVRRLAGGRVHGLEAELVGRANRVFACTDRDARRFQELYGVPADRLSVIPNGIDLRAVERERIQRAAHGASRGNGRRRRAIFAGSDVAHNRAVVKTIATQLAPALAQVDFVVIGSCARRVPVPLPSNLQLRPEGDVADFAGTDAIALNPVTAGSGSSMKLLHYLACDLAVLSTPFGVRGFDDLRPWVTTAELSDFVQALQGEIPPPHGHREQLARYEWDAVAERAVRAYTELAGRP
ncbi:MAG TPA: glycosyltransferase [Gemmatimonadaceae bacterium]|nr:glycosyltransferase [Gemmatimonadaceae bacterium]